MLFMTLVENSGDFAGDDVICMALAGQMQQSRSRNIYIYIYIYNNFSGTGNVVSSQQSER